MFISQGAYMSKLNTDTREAMQEYAENTMFELLCDEDVAFEKAVNGHKFIGVANMSDERLVDFYLNCCGRDKEDLLYVKAQAEIAAHNLLTITNTKRSVCITITFTTDADKDEVDAVAEDCFSQLESLYDEFGKEHADAKFVVEIK
jgi:hypothetical protein